MDSARAERIAIGGQDGEKQAEERRTCYMASRRLLSMAGVAQRQHRLRLPLVIGG